MRITKTIKYLNKGEQNQARVFLALQKMSKTRNGFSCNTSLRFERPGEAIFRVITEAGINTLQGVRKWELKKSS
jgi:hypothetical protein